MAPDVTIYCLEQLTDYFEFERLCHDLMARHGYSTIEPLGGFKDRGRDALHRDQGDVITIFAYSVRENWRMKLAEDAKKIYDHGHECAKLVFLTTATFTAGERDEAVTFIKTSYGWTLDLYGVERLRILLDVHSSDIRALHPSIFPPRFYREASSVEQISVPQTPSVINFGFENTLQQANIAAQNTIYGNLIQHVNLNSNSASVSIPKPVFQLRPALGDFVGRQNEYEVLVQYLVTQSEASLTCCIYGMGGIGKTELALLVGHTVASSFPGGQIFVSMRGSTTNPRMAQDGLKDVILSLDQSIQRLPQDVDSLASLYRGLLDSQRILIVVDDVSDTATLRHFQVPVGCALLVTSRNRLVTDTSSLLVEVPPLLENEATPFLLHLVPRLKKDLNIIKLVHRCGGHPLALRIIGAILVERPQWSANRYLMRLDRDSVDRGILQHQDRNVSIILGLSYDLLVEDDPSLAKKWRMLYICPAAFSISAAAAIWNEDDIDITEDNLISLRSRSLLTYDDQTQMFLMHDLLRDIARNRCSLDEKHIVPKRHSKYYYEILLQASALLEKGHKYIEKGLSLFDVNQSHIMLGQHWASTHIDDLEMAQLCITYALGAPVILSLRLLPSEWMKWIEAAEQATKVFKPNTDVSITMASNRGRVYASLGKHNAAIREHIYEFLWSREINSLDGQCKGLINLGNAFLGIGQTDYALNCFSDAYDMAIQLQDELLQGSTAANMGRSLFILGKYEDALRLHQKHLDIATRHGDRRDIGIARSNLGVTYIFLGKYKLGLNLCNRGLKEVRKLGDKSSIASILGEVSLAYRLMGRYEEAIVFHEERLRLAYLLNDRRIEGDALCGLGANYLDLKQFLKALEYHRRHLSVVEDREDLSGQGTAFVNIAIAYHGLESFVESKVWANQALRISRKVRDISLEVTALNCLANTYKDIGEKDQAMNIYQEALIVAKKGNDPRYQASISWNIGVLLEGQGQYQKAIEYMQKLVDFELSINHPSFDEHAEGVNVLRTKIGL